MLEWYSDQNQFGVIKPTGEFPFSIDIEIEYDGSGDWDYYEYTVSVSLPERHFKDTMRLSLSGCKGTMALAKAEAEERAEMLKEPFIKMLKKVLGRKGFKDLMDRRRRFVPAVDDKPQGNPMTRVV